MSILTRLWIEKKAAEHNMPFAKVMEHLFSDGTLHYTMRNRHGKPANIDSYDEAMKIVNTYMMSEVNL